MALKAMTTFITLQFVLTGKNFEIYDRVVHTTFTDKESFPLVVHVGRQENGVSTSLRLVLKDCVDLIEFNSDRQYGIPLQN